MLKKHFSMAMYFPPGYEYEKEKNAALLLLGIGAGLSLRFFTDLFAAAEKLYETVLGRRVLKAGVQAVPFAQLVQGHWVFYIPLLFLLFTAIPWRYFYYYHATKSIYLMRRLPRHSILFKSCTQGSVLLAGTSAALLTILYLLYYGFYWLVIPAECLP